LKIRHKHIREVYKAYVDNFVRASRVPDTISMAYQLGGRSAMSRVQNYISVYGSTDPDERKRQDGSLARKLSRLGVNMWKRGVFERAYTHNRAFQFSIFALQPFKHLQKDGGADFEAIMYSQLVSMWTAFETMVGDLWEAVLKTRKILCVKVASAHRKKGLRPTPSALCNETKFSSRPAIRDAYKWLGVSADIENLLDSREIDSLCLVRNLIAHKSGKVDRKFRKDSKGCPGIPTTRLKRKIPVDGQIVWTLLGPVRQLGIDLLIAMDEWI